METLDQIENRAAEACRMCRGCNGRGEVEQPPDKWSLGMDPPPIYARCTHCDGTGLILTPDHETVALVRRCRTAESRLVEVVGLLREARDRLNEDMNTGRLVDRIDAALAKAQP